MRSVAYRLIPSLALVFLSPQTWLCAAGQSQSEHRATESQPEVGKETKPEEGTSSSHEFVNFSLEDGGKLSSAGAVPPSEIRKTVAASVVPWRSTQNFASGDLRCGIKALFAFLRLHGVEVDLPDLEGRLSVNDEGIDMLQLRDLAREYGVHAEVVECTSAELQGHLPAIARLSMGTGSEASHYHVVSRLSESELSYIEPSTCRFEQGKNIGFSRYFTGYALVADDTSWGVLRPLSYLLGAVACAQVVALAVMLRRQ